MPLNAAELNFLAAWANEEKAHNPYVLPAHILQAEHHVRGVDLIRMIKAWAKKAGRPDEDIFALSHDASPHWPWASVEEWTERLSAIQRQYGSERVA